MAGADSVSDEEATSSVLGLDPERVRKALDALLADAERCDGELARADVDRAYLKRKLSIAECEAVESALRANGVAIDEPEDDEDEDDAVKSPVASTGRNQSIRIKASYLTQEEERSLGRAIQLASHLEQSGEATDLVVRAQRDAARAKTRLVESNVRWVMKLVKQAGHRNHLTEDDLFQEGVTGLLHATELFDPDRGFRFKTYATWWIRQRITRAIANDDRTVRLPVYVTARISKIGRTQRNLQGLLGRPPTVTEVANELGIEPEDLQFFMWQVQETNCVEGDAPIDDNATPLLDIIPDKGSLSQFDEFAAKEREQDFKKLLPDILTAREYDILCRRFGMNGSPPQKLEEIGKDYGVTRERIRQLEARALKRLARPDTRKILRNYLDETVKA